MALNNPFVLDQLNEVLRNQTVLGHSAASVWAARVASPHVNGHWR
jgi:hypothetical protein